MATQQLLSLSFLIVSTPWPHKAAVICSCSYFWDCECCLYGMDAVDVMKLGSKEGGFCQVIQVGPQSNGKCFQTEEAT